MELKNAIRAAARKSTGGQSKNGSGGQKGSKGAAAALVPAKFIGYDKNIPQASGLAKMIKVRKDKTAMPGTAAAACNKKRRHQRPGRRRLPPACGSPVQ